MGALPLIATAAQGVVSYLGKNAVAKAQDKQHVENATAAGKAAVVKSQALNENYQRNMEVLSGQEMDSALKSMQTQAAMESSASEGGVGGQSISGLERSVQAAGLRQESAIKKQADQLKYNVTLEAAGVDSELQNRINSAQRGQKANLFTELGMAGLSYATSRMLNPEKAGTTKLQKINIKRASSDLDALFNSTKGLF